MRSTFTSSRLGKLLLGSAAALGMAAAAWADGTPINGGTGAFAAGRNNSLYSVNFDTGKGTLMFTDTAFAGINGIGYDQATGIYYYTDNTSANANRAIYGWNSRTGGGRFTVIADVTTLGATLGTSGVGSGAGDFAGGFFWLGTEGSGASAVDEIYRVTLNGTGTAATAITLLGTIPGGNDFGDILVDAPNNRFFDFDAGGDVVREYAITPYGLTQTDTIAGADIAQAARDRNDVLYNTGAQFQTYNPTDAGTVGGPITITTNGTTGLGALNDASGWMPAEASIGDRVFYDTNANGVDNAEDGISDLTVQLYDDLDGDGAVDAGETLLATTTTNATGAYFFGQLLPGDYLVRILDPTNILNGGASTTGGFIQTEAIRTVGTAFLAHDFGFQDNRPALSINNVSATEGTDAFAIFNVQLSRSYSAPITVSLALANVTAIAADYGPGTEVSTNGGANWTTAATATFAAGTTSILVRTPIVNDALDENSETFTLTATRTAGVTTNAFVTGTGAIVDNDPTPAFTINDVTRNEDGGTATFTVTLSGASSFPITVGYATASGTATSGADFTATSGTLNFAAGATTQTIIVPILDDTRFENSEAFNVTLSAPTNATIGDGAGVGTILDNGTGAGGTDNDTPALSVGNVTAIEGTDPFAIFNVALSNASNLATTVSLALANGSASAADFGPGIEVSTNGGATWMPSTTATFAPGTTSVLVRTPVSDDALDENAENCTLTATVTAGTTTNPNATGTGTITDNDAPPVFSINDVTRNEDGVSATFTVTLSAPSALPVTVGYATASGTATSPADFTATSGTLNFAPGATTQTFTVSILDDAIFENSEAFNVTLSGSTNATIGDGTGLGTILDNGTGAGGTDDDTPTLSVNNVTTTEGTDPFAVFAIALSNAANAPTTVSLALANGTAGVADYGPSLEVSTNGGATWTAGTNTTFAPGSTGLLVRTPVVDDALAEVTENFTLTATRTTGATTNPNATGTATIVDNENANLSINDLSVNEEAGPATFTVTLSTPSALTVTVNYATASGTATSGVDFTATSGTLTFAPGVTTRTITVPILDDAIFENSETFAVTLSSPTNATIADGTGAGTILDNAVTDNRPPVATNDTTSTPEETPITIAVLANDTDPDSDPLTVTSATVPAAQGSVIINPNGTLRFTPAPNFNGTATIDYSIADGNSGTASAIATVNVTPINDAPIATNDTATTPEGRPIVIEILANDFDPENNPLTVTTATLVDGRGTVAVNSDGTIEFTPAPGFNGSATVVYTISDGQGGTATATVSILVDALPIATDDFASTTPGTAKLIPVLNNDSDPEGLPLTVISATILPSQGTLTIDPSGQLRYTPAAGVVGTVVGSYTIRDAAGNIASADVTITIAQTPPPEPPIAVSDAASTTQQTPVTIFVLQNDSDPANGALTVISASVPAVEGTVAINPDGTLTFTAAAGFEGSATITYTIRNPAGATTAPATVQVAGGNAPPLAQPDSATAATGVPKVVRLLGNDSDPDGDPLSVTSATVPPAQGTVQINPDRTVTFTSALGFTGTATITYQITDGNGGTSSSTISVAVSAAPANAAPVAMNDAAATPVDQPIDVNVLANDTDPDGDPLTVTSVTVPAGQGTATINPDGTIRYMPVAGLNDDVVLSYTIADSQGAAASALVTINVNDNPITVADRASTLQGTAVAIAILGNDSDPNGNPIALTAATSDPAEGALVINPDGTIRFTPASNFTGIAEVSYTITDGKGGTAEGTAYVTVNSPPTPVNDTAATPLNQPVTIAVLTNDIDPDADSLTVIGATVDPAQGTVAINPDGTLTFTPAATFTGPAVIAYTVTDSNGARATATATVTRGNLAPAADDRTVYTFCMTAVRINALRTATDADGNPLTVIAVSQPRFGRVLIQPGGNVLYRPNQNYNRTTVDTFVVTLSDGQGGTTTETITVRSFAAIAGNFQGLLVDTAPAVTPTTRGRLTITLNNRASFTARLELDGNVARFTGTLSGPLRFQRQLRINGQLTTLTLTYNDLADRWSASLTGGSIAVQQEVNAIKRRPAVRRTASAHRVQLVPRSGAPVAGTAIVRVGATGIATIIGTLPDGVAFSSAALLDSLGSAATFDWVPQPTEIIGGAIQFNANPNPPTGALEWNQDAASATPSDILDLAP